MTKQKLVATLEIFNFKKEEKGLLKQSLMCYEIYQTYFER